MEPENLAELGQELVHDLDLKRLRERFRFSRSAQAHMIGVSPTALQRWEEGAPLSRTSAERVATWWNEVQGYGTVVEDDLLEMIELGTLVHVTVASQQLAMSYGSILERCRTGMLRCVHLGPLGFYLQKAELLATA